MWEGVVRILVLWEYLIITWHGGVGLDQSELWQIFGEF